MSTRLYYVRVFGGLTALIVFFLVFLLVLDVLNIPGPELRWSSLVGVLAGVLGSVVILWAGLGRPAVCLRCQERLDELDDWRRYAGGDPGLHRLMHLRKVAIAWYDAYGDDKNHDFSHRQRAIDELATVVATIKEAHGRKRPDQ